jgi:tetratricopeptide (TPR) repeat protein
MHERGMLEQAINLAYTGLDITKALSSETRLLQADLWTTIGAAQVAGSLVELSYESLERALNLRLSAVKAGLMDETHPQIANSYMSLGTAAVGNSERVQEAINLGEKSIWLREGRAEEQIQMLALSHHNVALAALTCGQLEKADTFIEKSMEISAETCQSMTPEQKMYVTALFPSANIPSSAAPADNNVYVIRAMDSRNIYCKGNILWAQGRKKEARECHAKALQVRLRTFGETHPYSACAYWKLGQVWEEEDWKKAEYVDSHLLARLTRLQLWAPANHREQLHQGALHKFCGPL